MDNVSQFTVEIHDSGPDARARVRSIFNYMQTAADRHSRSLGTSVSSMSEKNLTWVYTRFYADIEKYPELYEKVYCSTWRSVVLNGLVCREFIITGEGGAPLVKATSSLALIDRTTRRPVPIPDSITSQLDNEKGRSIEFPIDISAQNIKTDYIYETKTRYEDIDINGHMNNASYAAVFFESLYSVKKDWKMKSIDVFFRGEIIYGEELECRTALIKGVSGRYYHELINKSRGRISATAVTGWENNSGKLKK